MKIIQITDLHVGEPDDDSHGVDVRGNFLSILEEVQKLAPDRIVLTGDLCLLKGLAATYRWQKLHLDNLGIPYEIIGGNHDDPVLLAEAFDKEDFLENRELYFQKNWGGLNCFFLDTIIGRVSQSQLHWLRKGLTEVDAPVVIFMHHPPVHAGVNFMDTKYPMKGLDRFQSLIFGHRHPVWIFCGHYHVEKTIVKHNMTVHITPSTYVQINQESPEFAVDHHRIALREIQLEPDTIRSTVKYYKGKKIKI